MPVICPTSQADRLRHVGTTGKSVDASEKLSSEQQLLQFVIPGRCEASSPESIPPSNGFGAVDSPMCNRTS
jgi:hypothetical protein